MMKIHLIAIGGSAMHNLAIALHRSGHTVSGSDDEIFEPSRTRLQREGLLPATDGWFPDKIDASFDAIILGMHARVDNPELLRAQELGLKIYSYPGYIYQESRDKTRAVIGGSHGKTSITAMVLHAMSHGKLDCDYLVGAQLKGFDTMVRLTPSVSRIVLEGDEYLASPIERVPKFHLYHPHVALISGIAWDHINVFPTFESYVEQFRLFTEKIEQGGTLVYFEGDPELVKIAQSARSDLKLVPYTTHPHSIRNGITCLETPQGEVPLQIFGKHNLQNVSGALEVCRRLGLSDEKFYSAIGSFEGAARRLEPVFQNERTRIYKDFAHSPSKLKATTEAVREQFPQNRLIACMELHTFSSLNAKFLEEYKGSMAGADEAFVYFNPHTVQHKKLEAITKEQVSEAFGTANVQVFDNSQELLQQLQGMNWNDTTLLMMTSGNFDGIKFEELSLLLGLNS
jgi:UDP-N-acetylmuramate: L-alanyl-gamma-D-glutamyl-meso-diaminopimelate ligase